MNLFQIYRALLKIATSARRSTKTWLLLVLALLHCALLATVFTSGVVSYAGRETPLLEALSSAAMSSANSKIEIALKGSMKDKATETEKTTISRWIASGANQETYLQSIEPIIKRSCISCHNGNSAQIPNFNGYTNLLKFSIQNNEASGQLTAGSLTFNRTYLLLLIVSLVVLTLYASILFDKPKSRQVFASAVIGFCLIFSATLFIPASRVNIPAFLTIGGLLILVLLFIAMEVRAFRSLSKKTPPSINTIQTESDLAIPFYRKHLKSLIIGTVCTGLILSFVGYRTLKYVRDYGICLGVMCHYTGEIDEFEKNYWQIESPVKRTNLPEFKILKALSTDQLTPSNLENLQAQFKTWEKTYGDSHGTKYSSLDHINKTNINRLKVAWEYRSGDKNLNTLQSSPIIANKVLYSPTSNGTYTALEATTGQELWKFKPASGIPAYRGMAWWKDPTTSHERLFFIAGDKLHSLDAKTGRLNNDFGSNGTVQTGYSHPAPVTTDQLVIIATFDAKIVAYDIRTGTKSWSFETRKTDQSLHRGGGRFSQVGSNVWSGMSLDSKNGLLFATVGNPRPPNYGALRPGPNLYSNSVVALDVNTGRLMWFFQETAHDLWDMDISSPPLLTTIERDNQFYDVVVATSKAGNTILLDRRTGGLIFDFRLRRAPTSTTPGEHTTPYQPDLVLPQPFAKMEFSRSDITDIGDKNRRSVLAQLEGSHMGFYVPPVINANLALFGLNGGASWPGAASNPYDGMLYIPSNRFPWIVSLYYSSVDESQFPASPESDMYQDKCAACHGENRQGKYEETTYVPTLTGTSILHSESEFISIFTRAHTTFETKPEMSKAEISALYSHFNKYDRLIERDRKSGKKFQFSWRKLRDSQGYPGSKPPWGQLTALDLNTGLIKWQVPFGNYDEIGSALGKPTGQPNAGGAMVTAGGLVFATGTVDGKLRAFDKDDGSQLWSYKLPFNGSAPPVTYEIDGEQYLVVMATGRDGGFFKGLGDAMIAFKIQ